MQRFGPVLKTKRGDHVRDPRNAGKRQIKNVLMCPSHRTSPSHFQTLILDTFNPFPTQDMSPLRHKCAEK